MMARSSWSRAEKPPFEIGEIPDDQAVEYLTKKGIREDEAKVTVANLTGGLFVSLNDFASSSLEGMTYEQLVEQRDSALAKKLRRLKVAPDHAMFQQLVKCKSVRTGDDLGMAESQLDLLLLNNILAAHPNETYTFHDRHTATWFSREVKKCEAIAEQRENEKKKAAWWPGR